jgi:hypothetical protein
MYKSFEKFGVEVFEKNELIYQYNFDTLKEAIKFETRMRDAGHTCKFISIDKYGNKIQDL